MSAYNWGVCPKCKKEHDSKGSRLLDAMVEADRRDVLSAYKIAKSEYDKFTNEELVETLREDYECFINPNGRFYISYNGTCDKCGFSKKFKIDEIIEF